MEFSNFRTLIAERSAQKQRILGIIADKQDAELKNMSVEELQAKLNELN